jgi:hypothetical protein
MLHSWGQYCPQFAPILGRGEQERRYFRHAGVEAFARQHSSEVDPPVQVRANSGDELPHTLSLSGVLVEPVGLLFRLASRIGKVAWERRARTLSSNAICYFRGFFLRQQREASRGGFGGR